MQKTTPRTVLITGAAGGLSAGMNERLAEAGHRLVLADLRREKVEREAQRIHKLGGEAFAYEVDVSDTASVRRLYEQTVSDVGDVEVLINAAGVLDRKFLTDHNDDSFARAIDINLTGPFRLIQLFSPAMVKQGWGRIINISSIAGVTGYTYPSYAASKGGLSNLTRSLLQDFWGTGVTVNSICPGVVDTPFVIQEVRDQVQNKVPTGAIVTPQEVGGLATFLLTDDARNINGADLMVDGGVTATLRLIE